MNIQKAQTIAIQTIRRHLPNYTFRWSNSQRVFGTCNCFTHTIELSKPLASLNPLEIVMDTILHEIAHGLAGAAHGHDWYWRQKCIQIGAKPERCYGEEVTTPYNYEAICPCCGRAFHRLRKPRNQRRTYCTCQKGIPVSDIKFLEYHPKKGTE